MFKNKMHLHMTGRILVISKLSINLFKIKRKTVIKEDGALGSVRARSTSKS